MKLDLYSCGLPTGHTISNDEQNGLDFDMLRMLYSQYPNCTLQSSEDFMETYVEENMDDEKEQIIQNILACSVYDWECEVWRATKENIASLVQVSENELFGKLTDIGLFCHRKVIEINEWTLVKLETPFRLKDEENETAKEIFLKLYPLVVMLNTYSTNYREFEEQYYEISSSYEIEAPERHIEQEAFFEEILNSL